jgi:hypothetical protein
MSRHYTGWARLGNLAHRLTDHAMGRGARLTQLQVKAGGAWLVADVEHGVTRDRETQLKERGAARRCTVCKAEKALTAGKMTAAEALRAAGWDKANAAQRGLLIEDFGLEEVPADLAGPEPEPEQIEIWHERTPAAEVTPEQRAELDRLADGLIAQWTASPKGPSYEMEIEIG